MQSRTSEHGQPPPWQVGLGFAVIYVVWGSTYLGMRIAVETLPPFLMAGVRFIIAGSLLFLWLRWRGVIGPTLQQWRNAAIAGALMFVGGNGLVVWAEQSVPSGQCHFAGENHPLFCGSKSPTPRWV